MTVLPKGDQCVAMLTVVSPVTQIADTAVNSASSSGVASPDAEAWGNISKLVVRSDSRMKIKMVTVAAELPSTARTRSPTPATPGRGWRP
ncbi:MAG: Uncharacterised protein [Cellulomonadaceae bacterium TMED98]|nr:MAG: Uncharacterised protein [Cellulomonadaceae bacterium TMED98]